MVPDHRDLAIEVLADSETDSTERVKALELRIKELESRPQLKWAGVHHDGQPYAEAQLVTRSIECHDETCSRLPQSPESERTAPNASAYVLRRRGRPAGGVDLSLSAIRRRSAAAAAAARAFVAPRS